MMHFMMEIQKRNITLTVTAFAVFTIIVVFIFSRSEQLHQNVQKDGTTRIIESSKESHSLDASNNARLNKDTTSGGRSNQSVKLPSSGPDSAKSLDDEAEGTVTATATLHRKRVKTFN